MVNGSGDTIATTASTSLNLAGGNDTVDLGGSSYLGLLGGSGYLVSGTPTIATVNNAGFTLNGQQHGTSAAVAAIAASNPVGGIGGDVFYSPGLVGYTIGNLDD